MGHLNRQIAKLFGYDLMRYKKSFRFDPTLERLLRHHRFDAVIDVGANVGWFSRRGRQAMPDAAVYSFEPTPSLAADLERQAANDPKWTVVTAALGDAPGEATLHVAKKSVYNSLNKPNADLAGDMDGLAVTEVHQVPVSTLDIYADQNDLMRHSNILLKVDTQGHDYKVLKGARNILSRVRAVIVELPFKNIYDSDDNYRDIMAFMETAGFSV